MKLTYSMGVLLATLTSVSMAATDQASFVPNTFHAGQVASAKQVNHNFSTCSESVRFGKQSLFNG